MMKTAELKNHLFKPISRVKISRHRVSKKFIAMDLSDVAIFPNVHQFRSDNKVFAIHSNVEIPCHCLLMFGGVVHKVASIISCEVGTIFGAKYFYEVKCLVFTRHQSIQ